MKKISMPGKTDQQIVEAVAAAVTAKWKKLGAKGKKPVAEKPATVAYAEVFSWGTA